MELKTKAAGVFAFVFSELTEFPERAVLQNGQNVSSLLKCKAESKETSETAANSPVFAGVRFSVSPVFMRVSGLSL